MSTAMTLQQMSARGEAIGRTLPVPALVTLSGDLGAGKTTLVQAICRGLGVAAPVTSPTFALVHEYEAASARRVVHCDFYRLESEREVAALGFEDFLADPMTVVLVEWPERAGSLVNQPTLALSLSHDMASADVRQLREEWAR
jgi:tRNA threonylcarbamoyladenosine biosynthesis protein TsaE